MNLLFTSGGRRVSLIQSFKAALGQRGRVYATDLDPTAPALYVADRGFLSPSVGDPGYMPYLIDLVRKHQVRAIIPLIDPEIPLIARASDQFAALGCRVLTMEAWAVDVSSDKWLTAQFFAKVGVPSPVTALPLEEKQLPTGLSLPLIVKPRTGSSAMGVSVCHSLDEVWTACDRTRDPILQELLEGEEVTVDVLGDLSGEVVNVVQRKRLKVRAGEVERGITIRDPRIEKLALQAAVALKPVGCINLQCFMTARGPVFTEINPRFGGGYPLTLAAGADFAGPLMKALAGEHVAPTVGSYETGVLLLRYDSAVILREKDLLHDQGNHI